MQKQFLHWVVTENNVSEKELISGMKYLRDQGLKQSEIVNSLAPVYQKRVDDIKILPEILETIDANLEEQFCDIEIPGIDEIMPVLEAIQEAWGTSYLVGWSIRDPLLGRKPKDLDIEVHGLTQEQLMNVLKAHRWEPIKDEDWKVIDSWILIEVQNDKWAFTWVTMFQSVGSNLSEPLDFSLPRLETSTWADKWSFEFDHNPFLWVREASLRRENTINSIMYDPLNKKLMNPHGWLQDLVDKKLRVIDIDKFMEDPSRVARAMAFMVRFWFEPDEEFMEICKFMCATGLLDYKPEIKEDTVVVQEKKWIPWELWCKIFHKMMDDGKNFSAMFEFMRESWIWERYFPYLMELKHTPQDPIHHPEGNVETHTVQVMQKLLDLCEKYNITWIRKRRIMYSWLFHDIAKRDVTDYVEWKWITSYGHEYAWEDIVRKFFKFMKVEKKKKSNAFLESIVANVKEHMMHYKIFHIPNIKGKKSQYRKLLKRILPHGNIHDLLILMEADKLWRNNPDIECPEALFELYRMSQLDDCKGLPTEYVSGWDLIKRWFKEWRNLWMWKKKILELQYEDFFDSKEHAHKWLDEKLANDEDILLMKSVPIVSKEPEWMPKNWEPKGIWPKRKKLVT